MSLDAASQLLIDSYKEHVASVEKLYAQIETHMNELKQISVALTALGKEAPSPMPLAPGHIAAPPKPQREPAINRDERFLKAQHATREEIEVWVKKNPEIPGTKADWLVKMILDLAPRAVHMNDVEFAFKLRDPEDLFKATNTYNYLTRSMRDNIVDKIGGGYFIKYNAAQALGDAPEAKPKKQVAQEPANEEGPRILKAVTPEHVLTVLRQRGPSSAGIIKHTLRNTRPDVNASEEGVMKAIKALMDDNRKVVFKDNLYHDNTPFGKG